MQGYLLVVLGTVIWVGGRNACHKTVRYNLTPRSEEKLPTSEDTLEVLVAPSPISAKGSFIIISRCHYGLLASNN
jgi:hypothetical protein